MGQHRKTELGDLMLPLSKQITVLQNVFVVKDK